MQQRRKTGSTPSPRSGQQQTQVVRRSPRRQTGPTVTPSTAPVQNTLAPPPVFAPVVHAPPVPQTFAPPVMHPSPGASNNNNASPLSAVIPVPPPVQPGSVLPPVVQPSTQAQPTAPSTGHGKRLREVEQAASGNKAAKFNHTGEPREPLQRMAKGKSIEARQFRDLSAPSPEFSDGNKGRHEIASTSQRAPLTGKPVPMAAASSGRTSTGLTVLGGPNDTVVAHTGLMDSGLSTTGQATAHTPFHAFPATLAQQTDPVVAAAMTMQTALDGLAKPTAIRSDPNLTGAKWSGGGGPMEKPDTSRGTDDGYDSDTERGRFARRYNGGREHLKNTLSALRKTSADAAKHTRSPSPPRTRGGTGVLSSRRDVTLPDVSTDTPEEQARKYTEFGFLGMQSLSKKD